MFSTQADGLIYEQNNEVHTSHSFCKHECRDIGVRSEDVAPKHCHHSHQEGKQEERP